MKLIKYISIAFFILFSTVACEDYIGGDINSDPNNPTAVPISAQMPAFLLATVDNYGGDFSRFNALLVQQAEGVARQWSSFNQYTGLTPNRYDDAWQNLYENTLNEVKIARASSVEANLNHYTGLLNVVEAFNLMMATDVWDDMPYTEALGGIDAINPAYDNQSAIYAKIYSLLDEATSLFGGDPGAVLPGSEDILYGGDIAKWTKAAKAIRARGLLKDKDYAGAMREAMGSFESAADNLAYQYPDANAAAGWYRFNRDRTGDIEFHPTMRALMEGLNDTDRLAVMDQTFVTDHTYLVPNFLSELITYREMQFIIAEADVRDGGTQTGYDAYLNGIKASFDRLGLGSDQYEAYVAQDVVNPGVGNLTLEQVMTQKYIAMFLQPEAYSDWRRTSIPALTPVSGTAIPVRWHYSSDEYLFNSNSPSEADVNIFTDRVGWNK